MPQIKQQFIVAHPRSAVWSRFQDLPAVVSCIPGASLTEQTSPSHAKGVMTVKLGPVRANFAGEADIAADAANWTGTIEGAGMDRSHASRAKGAVRYVLTEAADGRSTSVDVSVDYTLSGSLAQFARGGIVEAIAGQITEEFARNLEAQLNAGPGELGASRGPDAGEETAPPAERAHAAPARELNAVTLLWRILVKKVRALFGR